MSGRVKLMQVAGRDLATELLPAPFGLWYSDHSTGCQMTIVADVDNEQVPVWRGSIWYSSIYDFNERGKIAGLQPDFTFAKEVIDKYFADLQSAVDVRRQARDERKTRESVEAQERKTRGIEAVRQQLQSAIAKNALNALTPVVAREPVGWREARAKEALFNIAKIHGYRLNDVELTEAVRAVLRATSPPPASAVREALEKIASFADIKDPESNERLSGEEVMHAEGINEGLRRAGRIARAALSIKGTADESTQSIGIRD